MINRMNKMGGMADIFLFMIISLVVVFFCGIFIYLIGEVYTQLHTTMDGMTFGTGNATQVIDNTMGVVKNTYQSLYWISVFLMVGMVISIFIGSYLVTTRPVFFVPYAFVTIISIIVAVGISNAYEQIIAQPLLASTFAGFVGANFIMLNLSIWVTVIGVVGGIIMFVRMGSKENELYGGTY